MDAVSMLQQYATGLFPGLLGIQFLEATAERVTARLLVRDDLCTVPGVMHGGAMMGFAGALGGAATALNLPPGAGTTTIESKTNFFAPATAGSTVIGECSALHRGERTLVWQTRVTAEDGRLLALVTQTQIVLTAPPAPAEAVASLFAGKSPDEQKALLATLERAGAGLYRAWAAAERDQRVKDALLAAAEREEANARVLEEG